jgi:hypothetical protein
LFALDLWKAAKFAIKPEQIEGVIGEPTRRPAASSAWSSEKLVRPSWTTTTSPSMMASPGMASAPANFGKAFGPVETVADQHLLSSAVEMDLDAISVVLDFMKSLIALGRPGLHRCELGFNEPRHGCNSLWQ